MRRAGLGTAVILSLAMVAPPSEGLQAVLPYGAPDRRAPVVLEHSYILNVRVRPLLLFWINSENVGEARVTWRKGSGGRRAFELLIGSDPARTPRQINRWGFILEELNGDTAEILGVMTQSDEKTVDEAEARTARQDTVSTFKAARTTIAGGRALSGSMTVHAPAHLTYRDLHALLALVPAQPPSVRAVELPFGTQQGFLVALDTLMRASVSPCLATGDARARRVPAVVYLYNQTLYDLSLLSCEYQRELRTKSGTFTDVVDGQFQVKNRTTHNETRFRIFYGTGGELHGVPARAVFRPRWWMEIEVVLDPSTGVSRSRSTRGPRREET